MISGSGSTIATMIAPAFSGACVLRVGHALGFCLGGICGNSLFHAEGRLQMPTGDAKRRLLSAARVLTVTATLLPVAVTVEGAGPNFGVFTWNRTRLVMVDG